MPSYIKFEIDARAFLVEDSLKLTAPFINEEMVKFLDQNQEWFQVIFGSVGFKEFLVEDSEGNKWRWGLTFVMGEGYINTSVEKT
jgi:hypothetical protein